MEKKLEKLFESEAFKKLDESKQNAVIKFAQSCCGKTSGEMLSDILKLNTELNKKNPLTYEEKSLMTDVILNIMSPEERKKLITVLSMLK